MSASSDDDLLFACPPPVQARAAAEAALREVSQPLEDAGVAALAVALQKRGFQVRIAAPPALLVAAPQPPQLDLEGAPCVSGLTFSSDVSFSLVSPDPSPPPCAHQARVRRSAPGGPRGHASAGLINMRHIFLEVAQQQQQPRTPGDDAAPARAEEPAATAAATWLILDPRLKEHLHIAAPTAAYRRLLDAVPRIFVGSAQQLAGAPAAGAALESERRNLLAEKHSFLTPSCLPPAATLALMCSQMAASFAVAGISTPPWRQQASFFC